MRIFLKLRQQKFLVMKRFSLLALSIFALTLLTSCEAINTIFEAGKWWGIIVAVVVIAAILFVIRGLGGGNRQ